ncbi:MAG: type II toxin-antitoxin system RelE/ParE family toxin [Dehalococcoidales bacterium]|nr:type II toxin-antitoxin system RelE/ParE family toxin [Dehalococcoidales bacterium]
MAYWIEIIRAVQKQVLSLPRKFQLEVAKSIDQLADTSRPSRCKRLRGTDIWRLRTGRYRVIYAIDDDAKVVTILKVALRREDTYRGV